jgi:hypothetical protein
MCPVSLEETAARNGGQCLGKGSFARRFECDGVAKSVERQLRGGLRSLNGTTFESADLDPEIDDQKPLVLWNWFENASAMSNSRSAQQ